MKTLLLAAWMAASCFLAASEKPPVLPQGKTDTWQGRPRHIFQVAGKTAWIVEPEKPLPGNLWTWVTEFPDAFVPRTGVPQLLKKGVWHAHVSDFNRLGSPEQLKVMDAFYQEMVKAGFAEKPVLIGLSRGGFMAYRWTSENTGKAAGVYGDAPVCDLKSWPGGFGKGKGSKADWELAKKLYGWRTDADAKRWEGNATDDKVLAALAKARIPLYTVVGTEDILVPVAENTTIVAEKYKKLGGEITVIPHKAGHHPHGLDDPASTVEWIINTLKSANP